jgi:Zn-finger nucleic acid-binding protein
MDCPDCGVEMVNLEGDDQTFRKCGDCGGLWVDVSDLNRLLLHQGMPGLESLGGKVLPDVEAGQCRECLVDMLHVEGGEKNHPVGYDTCEGCGGLFLESEFKDVADAKAATKQIVSFFTRFSGKTGKKKAAAG